MDENGIDARATVGDHFRSSHGMEPAALVVTDQRALVAGNGEVTRGQGQVSLFLSLHLGHL
ncbi:hypothetical protein ACFL5O_08825 [Myxococcota bacterium]